MEKIKNFFLENSNTRQTIIKNTFWLFTGEALGRLIKLGLIVYAARELGSGGWGIFAYALSVASLLMIFSDIGIENLVAREISQKKENHKMFISAAFLLKSIVLTISIALVIFVSPYISNVTEARGLFFIIAVIFFFDVIRNMGFAINRVMEKMEREMITKVIMNFVILGLGIVLINIDPSPLSLAIAYATGSATGALLILSFIRKNIVEFITKTNTEAVKLVLKTALPFAIISLVGSVMGNTDIFMLGIWKAPEDIGLYAAAQRFFQFIIIIPSMIASASFPLMARLANKDNEKFKITLEKILAIFMLIGIPTTFGGLILANQIIPFVFGQAYLEAIPVFQILMIMLLVSFPLILLINSIFVYNQQKKLVVVNVFGVVVNVILNFFLIPKFGITGAAVATLASTLIITWTMWRKMKKINNFEILPTLKTVILPVMVMSLIILILKYFGIGVIFNIIISSAVYFWVLFSIKKSIFIELKEIMGG
ncbi:MAG: Membrane protein involved in the export of O-antigen and teichoic acid [Candidatus Nomurabacteria bacterium GW2011_GWA1_37_20]|uniref:Membrane protein involved in the export of O-antigen and teichoic acid n=1 Tax=Candidatus Nomurabacteria bacterium GW2011_GWA1_37_20 TaxID=1618729 RepID=A0A0G0IXR6_9BACT|nr:MAG: Membrane protein involved in the export of O-antigen and teichoic acid [Candidatus Nomurabacteria bacterium GW2011_GWA1_37_20]